MPKQLFDSVPARSPYPRKEEVLIPGAAAKRDNLLFLLEVTSGVVIMRSKK
jgi:hypothetical protein